MSTLALIYSSIIISFFIFLVRCELAVVVDDSKYSDVISFASYVSSKWIVYGNTLTVINLNMDISKPIKYESAIEIISPSMRVPAKIKGSCNVDYHFDKTSILIISNNTQFKVELLLENYYTWLHYRRATLVMVYMQELLGNEDDF